MKSIKEVTVFTDGDSSKISTWSNVPYFFTETLLAKGIKVNRVDISQSQVLSNVFYKTVYRVLNALTNQNTYNYSRSYTHYLNVRSRIKNAIKQYPHSEADIFLTFSFSSVGLTHRPIVQFCDWTYDHQFKYFANREPGLLEKQAVKREDSQIAGADLIFPLFPSVADYMGQRYKNSKVEYLGNVINSLYEVSKDDILTKSNSNNLLFVGGKKYIEGANALISAFKTLKAQYPLLTLHIIGIEAKEFENLPPDIFCHGYLDKGDDAERALYYKIFKEAKIFVNTTPKWSAFSASIEAMYFYTPVIVTPYNEFTKTFGEEINFGQYCEENQAPVIREKILRILQDSAYKELCYNAHNAVKEFTWDAYMDKIISRIEAIM